MKLKILAIGLGIIFQTCTFNAVAESTATAHQRQSFSAGVTRTTNSGRSMSIQSNQTVSGSKFERNSSLELGNGTSASRSVNGAYDAESGTASRSVEGTRINGSTYSRDYTAEKTADGYQARANYTNGAGNTASSEVIVIQDKDNGTSTVTKSVTGFNGETHGSTVERTLQVGN